MFGGNSNWRGPIWMPVNALIIRALLQYYTYYGNDFTVECPTGSGRQMNLYQVAEEIGRRLANIFLQGQGRPAARSTAARRSSRTTRTGAICVLFYEYFHGDNGAGLAPAIRPAGRASSPGSCTCSRRRRPSKCSNSARWPAWSMYTNSRSGQLAGAGT